MVLVMFYSNRFVIQEFELHVLKLKRAVCCIRLQKEAEEGIEVSSMPKKIENTFKA